MNLFHRPAFFKGEQNVVQPVRCRRDQLLRDERFLIHIGLRRLARLEAAYPFQQRLIECAADRHHLAHGLHLSAQRWVRAWKFLELPARDLGHHVIDGRFKTSRRQPRDVIRDFIQPVAHREFRGDLRNWESGRLGSQRRGPRNTRIHLDNNHLPGLGIDGELHIGSAGIYADLAQARQSGVAHHLVLFVGQCLRWGNGYGITRMHAHRIEILNRAHDDAVVGQVAHHFEFVLFPAQHALFNQHFMYRRQVEPARQNLFKIFAVVSDATTRSAHGEARPQDHRKPDAL